MSRHRIRLISCTSLVFFFFFQAEDGIRDTSVTGVQTCALPISLRAGNSPPYLFVRSGQMVHVLCDEKVRHSIHEVDVDYLRGCFTRSADFRRVWLGRDGLRHEVATSPPLDAVRDLLKQPPTSWGLPPLESITGVPLIRPDGSVVTTPGYDSTTWVIYTPAPGFSISAIPDRPSDEAVERAVGRITEMY